MPASKTSAWLRGVGAESGGKVCNAGDAQYLDAHVPCDDRLRHGRHADQRRSHGAKGANLRRRLEAGSADGEVDALFECLALHLSSLNGHLAEALGICIGHVKEAQAAIGAVEGEPGFIGTNQRIPPHHVDVVGDENKLPDFVSVDDAARRIGENYGANAECTHHTHGKGDVLRRVALVEVHATLHDDNGRSTERARNQAAGVPLDRRLGEVGNRFVRHDHRIVNRVSRSAQSGSQHNAQVGLQPAQLRAQKLGSL